MADAVAEQSARESWTANVCAQCGGRIDLGEHVLSIRRNGGREILCWECAMQRVLALASRRQVTITALLDGEEKQAPKAA